MNCPLSDIEIKILSQREKIMLWLSRAGNLTTIQAREYLNIMSPASRVLELKAQGHHIVTYLTAKNRIAKYVLFSKKGGE